MTAALAILQGTQSMLTVLHRGPLRGSAKDENMLKLSCYQASRSPLAAEALLIS